jgi:hypothetical protein
MGGAPIGVPFLTSLNEQIKSIYNTTRVFDDILFLGLAT